ncbi:MAG: hypothetical protein M1816_006913 [Peltula sp. TS41687]|nr:MAG: hypothetical protein M1816_006913 [Peltula sp. TS41687]
MDNEMSLAAQPMNWNKGTKSKIRTTLGAGSGTGKEGALDTSISQNINSELQVGETSNIMLNPKQEEVSDKESLQPHIDEPEPPVYIHVESESKGDAIPNPTSPNTMVTGQAATSLPNQNEELMLIDDSNRESAVSMSTSVDNAKAAVSLNVHPDYDIQLQRRYFAIVEHSPDQLQTGQNPTSMPMKCLTCGGPEHPEPICPNQQVRFMFSRAI